MMASLLMVVVLGSSAMAFLPTGNLRDLSRKAGEQRWVSRALQNYRVAVAVRMPAMNCGQELEVRDGHLARVIYDSCNRSWLGKLTIARLFELSALFAQTGQCFPSDSQCACHRVRVGTIEYDGHFGYPVSIDWRRELRPNWVSSDYWERLAGTRSLKACAPIQQRLSIKVLALDPLEEL